MFTRAARFIYLNRTCWNGLYRVNLNGEFNVPIGTKTEVIYEEDNFQEISELLSHAIIYQADFEELIDKASRNDLIFVDPPYTVRHNHNGFIKYNEKLFSWDDQERLFYSLNRAKKRGAIVVGTNAYHKCIRDLYGDTFNSCATERRSQISAYQSKKDNFEELIFFTQ